MTDERSELGSATLGAIAAGEPGWLAEARARAWELHRGMPLPDRALHRWRYVDPARLVPGSHALLRDGHLETGEPLGSDAPAAVEVRRTPAGAVVRLSESARAAGVEVMDLSRAVREREDVVKEHLGRVVAMDDTGFAALNAAFWNGGLFVSIPRGVRLEKPVHVITEAAGAGLALPRNLMLVGDGADVTVLEELTGSAGDTGDGADLLVHRTNEVVVGAGARFELVFIQELPTKATAASITGVTVGRDATVREIFAAFGGGTAKADLDIRLVGRGANADVLGAVFGGGRQQFDHHTILEHHAPDTTSHLDVRVALGGRARSSATGRLWIGHEAVRSQAYQENRNLLLSEQSHAVSIPELEILTDEVQAKHGATVGPIDEDQLYYLNSRGLSTPAATAMIVGGFFEALLARVPEGLVTERVRARVEARLAH